MRDSQKHTTYFEWVSFLKNLAILEGFEPTTLVTDGRFSGATTGLSIGHVAPEAAVGGPIALIRDGDTVEIDLPERRLDLLVGDAELDRRRTSWQAPPPLTGSGFLAKYAALVGSAAQGALVRPVTGA